MCQSTVTLISNALHHVDNDEKLLRIKGRIALFMQTMAVRHFRSRTNEMFLTK